MAGVQTVPLGPDVKSREMVPELASPDRCLAGATDLLNTWKTHTSTQTFQEWQGSPETEDMHRVTRILLCTVHLPLRLTNPLQMPCQT